MRATIVSRPDAALPRADAKYSYSPGHASIGTVEPGERFEVESVEGFCNSFASAEDLTPERYAEAEKLKWAVTGPIDVAGAKAGGAVAVTIHSVEVTTPGVFVYGALHGRGSVRVVGRGERLRGLSGRGRLRPLRRAHDAADAAADRLPRRRARREASCTRTCRAATAGTWTAARSAPARRSCCRSRTTAAASTSATASRSGRRRDRRPARGRRARDRHGRAARAPGVDDVAAHRDGRAA